MRYCKSTCRERERERERRKGCRPRPSHTITHQHLRNLSVADRQIEGGGSQSQIHTDRETSTPVFLLLLLLSLSLSLSIGCRDNGLSLIDSVVATELAPSSHQQNSCPFPDVQKGAAADASCVHGSPLRDSGFRIGGNGGNGGGLAAERMKYSKFEECPFLFNGSRCFSYWPSFLPSVRPRFAVVPRYVRVRLTD